MNVRCQRHIHTSISFGRSEPKKIRCTIWPHRRVRRTVKFASAFERSQTGMRCEEGGKLQGYCDYSWKEIWWRSKNYCNSSGHWWLLRRRQWLKRKNRNRIYESWESGLHAATVGSWWAFPKVDVTIVTWRLTTINDLSLTPALSIYQTWRALWATWSGLQSPDNGDSFFKM